jgi:uncharacterized membrane protein
MTPREFIDIDEIVKDRVVSEYVFGTLGIILLILAVVTVVLGHSEQTWDKTISLVIALFGLLPILLLFRVRDQRHFYQSLKRDWKEAEEKGDQVEIESCRSEFREVRKVTIQSQIWTRG